MHNIDHPFYCVWCGNVLPDEESFNTHYDAELQSYAMANADDDVFDLVHNENNY